MKLNSYEISLIPNYGNEEIIINAVKKMGIKSTGITRHGGFYGCDTPVILDIECTEQDKNELKKILDPITTDIFRIFKRCSECENLYLV